MVLIKNHKLYLGALATTCLLILMNKSLANQLLETKHLAKFQNNCSICHVETPASKPVSQEKCISCHGDLTKIGNKPISKGEVNAHINHADEMYCNDCHNIHKPSSNYCEQCHDDGWGLKVP